MRLGLGPPRLHQQVPAERGEVAGQEGAVGLDALAAAGQHVAQQMLGLGPAAERLVGRGEDGAAGERDRGGRGPAWPPSA